jgi:hypothetical protein
MLVTLSGIVTLVVMFVEKNAKNPMLVTGSPSILLGMVTAPPEPMYLVIVIVPLLLV